MSSTEALTKEQVQEISDQIKDISQEMGQLVQQLALICDKVGDNYMKRTVIAELEIATGQGSWVHRSTDLCRWADSLVDEYEERFNPPEPIYATEEDIRQAYYGNEAGNKEPDPGDVGEILKARSKQMGGEETEGEIDWNPED